MGYTHYFTQMRDVRPAEWAALCAEANALITALPTTFADRPLKLAREFNEPSVPPVIDADEIRFNGTTPESETDSLDLGHETFLLTRVTREPPTREGAFSFCKTAYNLAVCAVLLSTQVHAPGAWKLGSDGDASDWQPARDFYTKVTGRAAPALRED